MALGTPAGGLVIRIRRRLDDQNARTFKNADVLEALDDAAKQIQSKLGILKEHKSFSLVANQREYTAPTTLLKPEEMEFWDGDTVYKLGSETPDSFRRASRATVSSSVPRRYIFRESERIIELDPRPDTAAGSTTLASDATAAATTLTVASTSDFPEYGRLIIGSEVIDYTDTTSTTFTGCTRGVEGTTAATHSTSDTVTERDVHIWGQRQYGNLEMGTIYTAGTVAITNGLTALVGTSSDWAGEVHAGDYFGITSNPVTTAPVNWYQISTVTDDTNIVIASAYGQDTETAAEYMICSPNPFPNYFDGALVSLALSQLMPKAGMYDQSGREYARAMAILNDAEKGAVKADTTIIYGSAPRAGRGRMAITMGSQTVP